MLYFIVQFFFVKLYVLLIHDFITKIYSFDGLNYATNYINQI